MMKNYTHAKEFIRTTINILLEPAPRESLSNAMNNSLAAIYPYELPEEIKPEFEEWWGSVAKIESIQATIDKMSNDEVTDCAYKILELYIRIEKHSRYMSSPDSDYAVTKH